MSAPILASLPQLHINTKAPDLGIPDWRASIEAQIDAFIDNNGAVRQTILLRSQAVDTILLCLFKHFELPESISLLAVGGYGRSEMLPFSDVDIMLLSESALDPDTIVKVESFVAALWDVGLEPGISVRSIGDCIAEVGDLTVATSFLESRLIIGNDILAKMPKKIVSENWTDKSFFEAKIQEQAERYQQNNNTEYNLEPNIKNAPGGLRDIHHIGWICKCYFRINKLSDLVHQSFMTNAEYDELVASEDFLLTIRHHLHRIAGRDENRLLFDFQRKIAEYMGYAEADNLKKHANANHSNAPIEALMRVYYRKCMRISTLTEMLISYYYETIIQPRLPEAEKPAVTVIDDDFEIIGYRIAARHRNVFTKNPSNLLRLFALMGQHSIRKIRAKTLRLLKAYAPLIDKEYREQAENRALFMTIIANPEFLFHRLRTMKRYGILGRYLPAFEQVTGLMQYDLFHRYTVDAHTLLVIRILHRLNEPHYAKSYNMVAPIYDRLERKDLIHLAALFHDIAKGRGGDHSELGASDAFNFCKAHGMSDNDANLVAWLVHHHLLMSVTAQKRDISDPEVVRLFAEKVGDVVHLNYLYVLTVADMSATNSELWNSWRSSLMSQLFFSAQKMLKAGFKDDTLSREELIEKTKTDSRKLFTKTDDVAAIESLWQELGEDYFLKEKPADILWQTRAILAHENHHEPLILIREHHEIALDAVQVFIYAQDKPNLFASTVNVFNQMDLDVQDARIITATRDFALDSYILIDRYGTLLKDEEREHMLVHEIKHSLENAASPKIIHKRTPRELKHFNVITKVSSRVHDASNQHEISIEALDEPGLLALIACIFLRHKIEVHSARITTLGERAEDMFMVTDYEDNLLSQEKITQLEAELIELINNPENAPDTCS